MPKPWQDLTDMFDTDSCIEEMVKKYKGTYLKICVKDGTNSVLARYDGWNGEYHVFHDSRANPILLAQDTDFNVTVWMPRRGLYNSTNSGMYLFLRLPFRQYRRGISKDSAIASPMSNIVLGGNHHNHIESVIFDLADRRLQAETSLDEAKDLANIHGSWAINRSFGIIMNFKNERSEVMYLMYEDIVVAEVVGHRIKIIEPMFRQELIEEVGVWANNYEVVE